MFFVPADKSANNVNVNIVNILEEEIVNSKILKITSISEIDITNQHGKSTLSLSATSPHRNAPTVYCS